MAPQPRRQPAPDRTRLGGHRAAFAEIRAPGAGRPNASCGGSSPHPVARLPTSIVGVRCVRALSERVGDVARRVANSPYGFGVVLSDTGVLLGRLRQSALGGDARARAAQVMESGPSTVRADTSPGELAERLRKTNLTTAVLSMQTAYTDAAGRTPPGGRPPLSP